MSMRAAWESNAGLWITWARAPDHDSYWAYHERRFLEIVPPPGALTLDIGSGEGRLGRTLTALGHHVVAVDASPTMAQAAASHPATQPVVVGDAARLPFRSGIADLAVAFMSLHDIDDYLAAIREAARVLVAEGCLCMALVHPMNSAGTFEGEHGDPDRPFVIRGSYLEAHRYEDHVERNGLPMTFVSEHRSLDAYSRALEESGFTIDALREVTDERQTSAWHRVPLFLHVRAVSSARAPAET